MTNAVLDKLEQIGAADPQTIARLRDRDAKLSHIRAQQYRLEKEQAEVAAVHDTFLRGEAESIVASIEAIDGEEDRELRKLKAEIARETGLPTREPGEAESVFQARATVASVAATRKAEAASLAAADVALLAAIEDPKEIASIATRALADLPFEHASRVTTAAEYRLRALMRGSDARVKDDAHRAALQLMTTVEPRRKAHESSRPEARIAALADRYDRRRLDVQLKADTVARVANHSMAQVIFKSALDIAADRRRQKRGGK
jgi:hypothetical protein